ncbi:MAG: M56 family metallopeptidase [Lysobacterales bacterium]
MNLGLYVIDVWLLVLALSVVLWSLRLPALLERARHYTPEVRARRLYLYALLPWALAWLSVILAFTPTWMVARGWIGDWCLSRHQGLASACPMHGAAVEPNLLAPSIALLVLLLAAVMALRVAWMLRLALRAAQRFGCVRRATLRVDGLDVDLVSCAEPVALSLCVPRDRVVLSEQLASTLDESELRALIEHERAHLARRDGVGMLVMTIASAILLPHARQTLRAAWALAVEQSCDRVAAYRVGALPLASALIKYARHAGAASAQPALASRFGQSDLEARVRALLDPPTNLMAPRERWLWSPLWSLPLAFVLHEVGEFLLLPLVR